MRAASVKVEIIGGREVEVTVCPPSRRRAAGSIDRCWPVRTVTGKRAGRHGKAMAEEQETDNRA